MQHAFDTFLAVAGRHPQAALAFVALVAFAESLAIVGTVVPAAVVMFAAGALVGHGSLDMAWTLGLATAGAVAGDALSYELGRHQEQRVRGWALFQRHPEAVRKAEDLIRRHGAVSIIAARFTGAVRAFVPLLAGFARMPPGRFYLTNVGSALLWAPAHILPGVVFGASLQLAEAASGRLVLLLLILAGLLWLAGWIAAFTIRRLVPLAKGVRQRLLRAAGTRTSAWARLVRLLLDPEHPGSEALLAALVLLLAGMWAFLSVVEDVVSQDPLVVADHAVFTFLQQLRTEPVDRVMIAITEMGSVGVMLPLVVAVAAWLLWRRSWRTAGYWIATAASSELVVQVLKKTLGRHRPLDLYQGVEQFSFPSGHATMSAVVLAFLAFLVTRGQSPRWRVAVGVITSVYVALVGFSRLYLGAHWLSDVIGGFSFGLAAVALASMVYTQHGVKEPMEPRRIAVLTAVVIVLAGLGWNWREAPADLRRYAIQVPPAQATTLQAWTAGGYRQLPDHRREFAGERKEALPLQVACGQQDLLAALHRAGWAPAPGVSMQTLLLALAPSPDLQQLAVLPRFDGGRRSELELVRTPPRAPASRDVLRLWRSDWQLPGATPIWYGAFYEEMPARPGLALLKRRSLAPEVFAPDFAQAGLQAWKSAEGGAQATPALWTCGGL